MSDPITHDVLATFEDVRSRLFTRLEGLTDAEYRWQPVADCMTIRPAGDGVFRADSRLPNSGHDGGSDAGSDTPDPVTTIAWRIWHIGSFCLRGYVIHFFDDAPAAGDRYEWPGSANQGVLALAEDWARFIAQLAALGDKRLMEPMGRGGEFGKETYLKLALHALDEVAHHGGEIGLLRDLYLREGG